MDWLARADLQKLGTSNRSHLRVPSAYPQQQSAGGCIDCYSHISWHGHKCKRNALHLMCWGLCMFNRTAKIAKCSSYATSRGGGSQVILGENFIGHSSCHGIIISFNWSLLADVHMLCRHHARQCGCTFDSITNGVGGNSSLHSFDGQSFVNTDRVNKILGGHYSEWGCTGPCTLKSMGGLGCFQFKYFSFE